MEFRMSYSSAGNDLYRLLPYRIYRQPVCDVLNTVYRKQLMDDAKQYSNAPYSKDKNVNLCSLFTKVYEYPWLMFCNSNKNFYFVWEFIDRDIITSETIQSVHQFFPVDWKQDGIWRNFFFMRKIKMKLSMGFIVHS